MQEDIIFRRRNRLKKHFVNVSNVLLYCYERVSDAAKITFQIIDGFDWESKETGESKGYVFPAVATLAAIRHTSIRTIQRHIAELIKVKLLTRIRQRNKPSILYIEDVSEEEIQRYFALVAAKENMPAPNEPVFEPVKSVQSRNDKNVVSHKASETTKMSFAYKEENEKKENEINVNENLPIAEPKKRYGMQGIRDIMGQLDIDNRRRPKQKRKKEKSEPLVKRDFLASDMVHVLGDHKSLGAYRTIAEKVPETVIREHLANVKETWQEGKIKKSRGALFISMIQQYCETHRIALGFQSTGAGEDLGD